MIARLAVLAPLLAVASCSNSANYYGEEFSPYYRGPREETSRERTDRKEIAYWASNPKDKRRIGFYETWEIRLRGSRETRECHYITDPVGREIGFVTNEGKFYRFDSKGKAAYINEYQIVTTGLKVFFGVPISHNIDIEEIDPYK